MIAKLVDSAAAAGAWIIGVATIGFLLFVGLSLIVALFHPDKTRRREGARALDRLLRFLRSDGSER